MYGLRIEMAIGRITVEADPAEVLVLLADLPGMLDWTAAEAVEVLGRDGAGRPVLARWRERFGPLPDAFVLQYDWNEHGVRWRLTEGRILKTEDGCYTVHPVSDGGAAVVYSLRLGLAVWLPAWLRSRIESAVVDATLSALRGRLGERG